MLNRKTPSTKPFMKTTPVLSSLLNRARLLLTVCLFFVSAYGNLLAQVTVIVDKIPSYTPVGDSLFLAGDFNNWNPGDADFRMTRNSDGTFSYTFPEGLNNFSFKVTRGSWQTVEGDINGKKLADRIFTSRKEKPVVHQIQVLSWEDMALHYSWNIIVNEIPDNTPFDAPIFVSGSFNNWNDHDPTYKLTRLDNGTYVVKIPKAERDTIWYKFHRGDWSAVESRNNGRTQSNRISAWHHGANITSINTEIAAWEDIGGGSSLTFTFILTASAIQAIVLILSLLAIRNRNNRVTQLLIFLLLVTALSLVARLATYNRVVFDWQPKLLLLADLCYFLYPPLFYALITRIIGVSFQWRYLRLMFALPFIAQCIFYFPLLLKPRLQFIVDNIDGNYTEIFNGFLLVATLLNIAVLAICTLLVVRKHRSVKNYGYQSSFSYTVTLLVHSAMLMVVLFTSHVMYSLQFFNLDTRFLHEYTIDALWIIFALSSYLHTFLVIRKPELFKLKDESEEKQKSSHQRDNLENLKTSLTALMKKQRPYLNAGLTLQDLADAMHTNMHTLSWLINEGYNKNFFDFINEHRIEEFKRLATSEQYKNYTFLAIAMEVGFNSKTTFNRAFKKSTGKTPREYFNLVQESQLEGIS